MCTLTLDLSREGPLIWWLGGEHVLLSDSYGCCPLVGWLGRGREVVPIVLVSGWLVGVVAGPLANEHPSTGKYGRVISGWKGQGVKDHGLVAGVALSVVITLW